MTTVDGRSISGSQLREMFAAATAWLHRHVDQVNAINVFPVPDGDTGTNMYLTMRSTIEEVERCPDDKASAVLEAMSRGALMGARGNSGVILSQIIQGMAGAVEGADRLDARNIARGLEDGAERAYRAVTRPSEGTILTVIRDAARAAREAVVGDPERDVIAALEAATTEAAASVARTPTLLPVLAEAGVVDAGGMGLSILLEGMFRHLKGEPMDQTATPPTEAVAREWLTGTQGLHQTERSLYGYCTEILVGGRDLNPESIRSRMLEIGDSVLVVGDERTVRVHVHTNEPGAVLSNGTSVGELLQVKVDNIRQQADRFLDAHAAQQPEAISTVAVAAGEGLTAVFKSFGCSRVISGGPTMNPSAREILEAIQACPSDQVIVLPNDKNIIMTGEQAAGLAGKRARVVHTRSIPQGLAALLALNQQADLDTNVSAMEEARLGVRTLEVTRAVRTTTIGGVKVEEGQIITILDDELKFAADSTEQAVEEAVARFALEGTSLVTLYYGADTTPAAAEVMAERLRGSHAGLEIEVVSGGQPNYQYIVSME